MTENKTQVTVVDPIDFIDAVEHPIRKSDAQTLNALFQKDHRVCAQNVGSDHRRIWLI